MDQDLQIWCSVRWDKDDSRRIKGKERLPGFHMENTRKSPGIHFSVLHTPEGHIKGRSVAKYCQGSE